MSKEQIMDEITAACNLIKSELKSSRKRHIHKTISGQITESDGCTINSRLGIMYDRPSANISLAHGLYIYQLGNNLSGVEIYPHKYERRKCINNHGLLLIRKKRQDSKERERNSINFCELVGDGVSLVEKITHFNGNLFYNSKFTMRLYSIGSGKSQPFRVGSFTHKEGRMELNRKGKYVKVAP